MKRAFFILGRSRRRWSARDSLERRSRPYGRGRAEVPFDVDEVHRKPQYSDVFQETKTEDGSFKMMKDAKKGVVLLADFTGQDARKMRIDGNRNLVEYLSSEGEQRGCIQHRAR